MTMQAAEIASLASKVIADAQRFQDTQAIFNAWFETLGLYIHDDGYAWVVLVTARAVIGKDVARAAFPTFAQALGYALDEAARRMKDEPV